MTARKKKELSFEEGMAQLEALVDRMTQGEMSLDETMKAYTDGMELAAKLEEELNTYKKKIEQIDPETAEITPFEEDAHGVS